MTLKKPTAAQVHALRDGLEADLEQSVSRAVKSWLASVKRAALVAVDAGNTSLVAAGSDEMPGLGHVSAWWTTTVDDALIHQVRQALTMAWNRWTDQHIEASPAEAATNDYLAQVRSRLVLGRHFGVTVYDDGFDRIRVSLARSAAEGWSRQKLAQHIAAELSWEKDGAYWRKELTYVDDQIDHVLDAIGPPGNPAREHARLTDPRVRTLRGYRNEAIKHLDAERSVWQTRATLIARTEATGAANFGAHQALLAEGVKTKMWLATGDGRTRPSHSQADSQEVGVNGMFLVGRALMRFPGDPNAPVDEVANCRCAMIGGDYV